MKEVTLPSIHTNGTSKEMLLRGWKDVVKALRDVEQALESVEFNARDYYVRDGAWNEAQAEMREAVAHLRAFRDYAYEMRNGISAGGFKFED